MLLLVKGGADEGGEKEVVDDEGHAIADMVGMDESAAEWMTGQDLEEDPDPDGEAGWMEPSEGSCGAVPTFRGARPSGASRRGRKVVVVCEQTDKSVLMTEARCSCGYLHTEGYPC